MGLKPPESGMGYLIQVPPNPLELVVENNSVEGRDDIVGFTAVKVIMITSLIADCS